MQPRPRAETSNVFFEPDPNFRFGSVCMKIIYTQFMDADTGKWMIFIGAGVLLLGVVIYFFHDHLGWIGHLPGDISVEKENFSFYFPLTTIVLVNLIVLGIMKIWKKIP